MSLKKTESATVLTEIVLLVFRLNGGFLEAADRISEPAGLTAARWKVLGAVLHEPHTVAEIGRIMGLARQSVQRLADALVSDGLAAYHDNPAHRSAKLLQPTGPGVAAIRRLSGRQAAWANAMSGGLNQNALVACRDTLKALVDRVEGD